MDAQENRGGRVEGGRRLNHREFNYDRERRFPRLCFLITLIIAHCAVPWVSLNYVHLSYLHLFLPVCPVYLPSSRMLGEIMTTYFARKKEQKKEKTHTETRKHPRDFALIRYWINTPRRWQELARISRLSANPLSPSQLRPSRPSRSASSSRGF